MLKQLWIPILNINSSLPYKKGNPGLHCGLAFSWELLDLTVDAWTLGKGGRETHFVSPNLLLDPHSCQSPESYSGNAALSVIPYSVYAVKVQLPKQHWWFQFIFFGSPMIWTIPASIRNIKYGLVTQKPSNFSLQWKYVCTIYDMRIYCFQW